MSYMENKMDNLIESGIHAYEEYCRVLDEEIGLFIKENKLLCSVDQVIDDYIQLYCKGENVSDSCRKAIIKFKERLEKSTGRKRNDIFMNNQNIELQDIRSSIQKIVGEEKELKIFKLAVDKASESEESNILYMVISSLKTAKEIILL